MTRPGPIHEAALAMIEQALNGAYTEHGRNKEVGSTPVSVRLRPGEDYWSGNLADGVTEVKIPDPDWDSVGGIIPDLILYKEDGRPHRIIEVIDTSPPTPAKRQKIEQLQRRGVDVVEIVVHTKDDLKALFPEEPVSGYRGKRLHRLSHAPERASEREREQLVEDFIGAVQMCTPAMRRRLVAVLNGLDTLESCYPVPPVKAD